MTAGVGSMGVSGVGGGASGIVVGTDGTTELLAVDVRSVTNDGCSVGAAESENDDRGVKAVG